MEAGDHGVLGEAAPAAGQAVEAEAAAQVGQPGPALGAVAAEQSGLHRDRVTLGEAGHAPADLGDLAGELVAELDRVPLPGQRVGRLGRGEDRPFQVLVQVGAADAAPVHLDLDGALAGLGLG
jgi:hypothetical protein